jgi:hypothetical protein
VIQTLEHAQYVADMIYRRIAPRFGDNDEAAFVELLRQLSALSGFSDAWEVTQTVYCDANGWKVDILVAPWPAIERLTGLVDGD